MSRFKRNLTVLITLVLLSLPLLMFYKKQAVVDWWKLHGYTAPAAVTNLALQDTMTIYARHVFYVNHPDLESDVSQFGRDCGEPEKTIVLGCYHSNQEGIFVFKVTDQRLSGVQQVTAAHEMLHAAYDRLNTKERNRVDNLLQSYYATVTSQRIIDTINSYKLSEPNDVVNEMHSVFGTEIANLPAQLEQYYSRYFISRQAITTDAANYEDEFTSREAKIKADDSRLLQMKISISAEESLLSGQLNQINSDRAKLNTERGDVNKYNSDVYRFNSEINAYNLGVGRLRTEIDAYNDLVSQRNAIAEELASLDQALDTRLTTQSSQ